MSKFTNPKLKKYAREKKAPKVMVSFRLEVCLRDQIIEISPGDITEWLTDAVIEKLDNDKEVNEEIKRRLEK